MHANILQNGPALLAHSSQGKCNGKILLQLFPSMNTMLSQSKTKQKNEIKKLFFNIPNAPPISAPLVGMLTLIIPQSEPAGLNEREREGKREREIDR